MSMAVNGNDSRTGKIWRTSWYIICFMASHLFILCCCTAVPSGCHGCYRFTKHIMQTGTKHKREKNMRHFQSAHVRFYSIEHIPYIDTHTHDTRIHTSDECPHPIYLDLIVKYISSKENKSIRIRIRYFEFLTRPFPSVRHIFLGAALIPGYLFSRNDGRMRIHIHHSMRNCEFHYYEKEGGPAAAATIREAFGHAFM